MFLILCIFFIGVYYVYSLRNFQYFSNKSIKHDRPIPIFGNHYDVIFSKQTETQLLNQLYKKYPGEKLVGYYRGTTPIVVIRDLDIIKSVLTVNFLEFTDRGTQSDTKIDPLMRNIFTEVGDTWKVLRHHLSPAFSGSKLKSMFPLIVDCTHKLISVADDLALKGQEFDACNLSARFTIDVIGACGFGIDMKSINNEHSLFLNLRDNLFVKSALRILISGLYDLFPYNVIKKLRFKRSQIIQQTIKKIFESVSRQRVNDTSAHDFMNLLLELGKVGKVSGTAMEQDKNGENKIIEVEFDEHRMLAQLYIFFVAGFETSSTVMAFALHQLAYNPKVQREVQEEIDKVLANNDNSFNYQSVSEMVLLEMVVKEALRLFPPGGALLRICTKDFIIPEVNIKIEAGTNIAIPVHAIQMDPMFFKKPEEFNPKRFSKEASDNRHKFVFLPYGEGPRKCIGARLGSMIVMAGLAAILHKFTAEPSPSSTRNVKINPASYVVQSVYGGLPLKLTLRKKPAEF